MTEERDSSVWSSYVKAKRNALRQENLPSVEDVPVTAEEMELALALATTAAAAERGADMPPRAAVHPSGRGRLTRWFYRTLVVLFAGLVAALLWWGNQLVHQR